MSGETEANVSGWTVDTLRAHLEHRINAHHAEVDTKFTELDRRYEQRIHAAEVALQAALTASERAIAKAETASEKRFESVNEFRAALSDQTASFISRNEYHTAHDALVQRVEAVQAYVERETGKQTGVSIAWAFLIGAVGLVATVLTIVIAILSNGG